MHDGGQPGGVQGVDVDVPVGQGHDRMGGGDGRQPVEERGRRVGAPSRVRDTVHLVRSGGHVLELLDQRRVDREGHRDGRHDLRPAAGRAAREALDDGQCAVESTIRGDRVGQSVVEELSGRAAMAPFGQRPEPADRRAGRRVHGLLHQEGGQLTHAPLVAVDRAVDVQEHRVDAVLVQSQFVGADRVAEPDPRAGGQRLGHRLEARQHGRRGVGVAGRGGQFAPGGDHLPPLQPHAEGGDRRRARVREGAGDRHDGARCDRPRLEAADVDPDRPVGVGRVVRGGGRDDRRGGGSGGRGGRGRARRCETQSGCEQRSDGGAQQRRPAHAVSASSAGARSTSARSSA
jgi:hypothetical protein